MSDQKALGVAEQHVLTTHNLVAAFLRDFAQANPEAMERIEAAMSVGAAWEVKTKLLPCGDLPEVSITLVTADDIHLHLADLTFDPAGEPVHKLN
jgi:2-phospho-L-lactate transferase/gluconeogenesis factor (CofD/UPF0052 family)